MEDHFQVRGQIACRSKGKPNTGLDPQCTSPGLACRHFLSQPPNLQKGDAKPTLPGCIGKNIA